MEDGYETDEALSQYLDLVENYNGLSGFGSCEEIDDDVLSQACI